MLKFVYILRSHSQQKCITCLLNKHFKEGITKFSNELNNKLTSTRQQNKYLLEYMGYMFRLVNSSKYVAYISQMNICCADVYWSLCYLEQKFVIICDCSKRLLPVLTQYLIQLFNLCAFNTSTRFNKTDNVRINVTMRHIRVTIVAISITYSVCVCVCVCLEP